MKATCAPTQAPASAEVIHLLVIREQDLLTKAGKFSPRKQNRAIRDAGLVPMFLWNRHNKWRAYAGPVSIKKEARP